ncbi:hypothetical protein BGY98DRAFT_953166 [Russula aff. rugulosa BPL654]|nr:hypothetical protein BGY98DRAFT_953166 [Russula aff. rugulosa BPL654]
MYFLRYIYAFYIGKKNEDSDIESDNDIEELVEHMLRTNGDPSRCRKEARRRALVRDGFRCIITRTYDYQSPGQSTELEQEVINSDIATTSTKCVLMIRMIRCGLLTPPLWSLTSLFVARIFLRSLPGMAFTLSRMSDLRCQF